MVKARAVTQSNIPEREAYLTRHTREVDIRCYINLDRERGNEPFEPTQGNPDVGKPMEAGVQLRSRITGEYGFWFPTSAHWIEQIPQHGHFELRLDASGDNDHHVSEDAAILVGQTLKQALGNKLGIARAGGADWVFEGNACHVAIDLSGRPDCVIEQSRYGKIADRQLWEMLYHFFRSLTDAAGIDFYAQLRATQLTANQHHLAEMLYKSFGRALSIATRIEGTGVASTKGSLG